MAITYPISLPSSPAPRNFTVQETSFSAMTSSPWSGSQQVQLNQGQLWAISIQLPPMSEDQARNWSGVMAQLNGRFGTFLYGDPKWKTPRGNWAGAPVVNGGGQSGQAFNISGLAAGAVVRAGDYFQLGSGASARLHKVTADAVADGAGAASLDIWPRLRSSPQDLDAIVTVAPQGVFRLASSTLARSWEPFRHGYSFDMVEAL